MTADTPGLQVVAQNRKARHDFFVLETLEAGLELRGTEVKSVRAGEVSLAEAFAEIDGGQLFVNDMHIAPYRCGNVFNHEPRRPRRLLLHRKEIERLRGQAAIKGLAIIPLRIYFRRGRAKLELGICRGKHFEDKRETLKRRDADLEARRAMSRARKG